jgi:AraC-like DNA-binding protein
MGRPISEYIKDLRHEKSCLLLCQTDLKVENIVKEVGYSDTSSFIRNFRSREGMTPGQYRKSRTLVE